MRTSIDKKKYLITLLITAVIFAVMLYVNNILDAKRLDDVKTVQDQIALDLLSSETQFNLLKETPCDTHDNASVLSQELNSLSTKLSYLTANNTDGNNAELLYVKKYYSLLEIKDYILMNQLNRKCPSHPISVLYFYGNKSDCTECEKMSFILTYLRQQYPELRIYSFDTHLDLSAVNTLKSIYGIKATELPAIVYKNKTTIGFKSLDEMKNIIPELMVIDKEKVQQFKATSTFATSSPSVSR